ncbi:HIT-like domain-containing protein [Schizophyllum commune]
MSGTAKHLASCIFCKIIKGEIPSLKLLETELSYSFLDINPLSTGHALVIPKYHAAKLHELPDEYLADAMPVAKKIAVALGAENYNILQNNGRIAHQVDEAGLVIGWPQQTVTKEELAKVAEEVKGKL